ncbi:MAG: hypothetical protein CL799_08330 [Chromatiales bacterium]|nr:hypothetical protein [Chromatiales bacterium]
MQHPDDGKPGNARIFGVGAFLIVMLAIALVIVFTLKNDQKPSPLSVDWVFGSYYDLKITSHRILPAEDKADGGGMALIDDRRVLLTTGEGTSYLVVIGEDLQKVSPLPI